MAAGVLHKNEAWRLAMLMCLRIYRGGGEECMVMLPNTDLDGAGRMAERFRSLIAQMPFSCRRVTASFGIAAIHNEPLTADALIIRADQALYAAKRQGRNTVVGATFHAHMSDI